MKKVILLLGFIAGSAFAQAPQPRPNVDAALTDYQRGASVSGAVRSVGSSTLSNLLLRWGAEFYRLHPAVDLQVTGGGSESAVPALIEGRADIGPMSRPVNDREIERFREKFGYAPARLTVAIDAVAIYVNKRNPIMRVSLPELRAIYSAPNNPSVVPIRTWGQLGLTGEWAAQPIVVKGPAPTQGIYGVFRAAVLGGADYRLDMRPEPVASSIVQAVATEDGAIGFASHFLAAARTKTLAIADANGGGYFFPLAEHTIDGTYPLARKLFIYVNRAPGAALTPVVLEFLRFICSKQAQEIAARDGNFPIDAALAAQECAPSN
jgi:phosphate transport system substrate-binding protein